VSQKVVDRVIGGNDGMLVELGQALKGGLDDGLTADDALAKLKGSARSQQRMDLTDNLQDNGLVGDAQNTAYSNLMRQIMAAIHDELGMNMSAVLDETAKDARELKPRKKKNARPASDKDAGEADAPLTLQDKLMLSLHKNLVTNIVKHLEAGLTLQQASVTEAKQKPTKGKSKASVEKLAEPAQDERDKLKQTLVTLIIDVVAQLLTQGMAATVEAAISQVVAEALDEAKWDKLSEHLSWNFWGQHEAAWPAYYNWPHVALRPMHSDEEMKTLNNWLAVAASCGWWEPFEGICFVCERMQECHVDDTGRLHNTSGAALLSRDGFSVYADHGVILPDWVIERPEEITVEKINKEDNTEVKRVMVERMGWERFIAESKATVLDERYNDRDLQYERLYKLPDDSSRFECSDPSTGRKYFLGVPNEIRNCEEAQNWLSHGLDRFAIHRS
jgi:hypothetical protein